MQRAMTLPRVSPCSANSRKGPKSSSRIFCPTRARWRLRYQTNAEPTVEHHAQMCLMQALGTIRRYAGAGDRSIELLVAEPYAPAARLLESRVGLAVRPRADDYELAFPARWLDQWTPIAALPPNLPIQAFAPYRNRPLPRAMAEAVLVALELHDDLSVVGIERTASEIGMPPRTLQHALRREDVSFREITRHLRIRRARQLLATTERPLAEVALRAGYTDPSNFHRAFLSQTGMTPGRFREALRSHGSSEIRNDVRLKRATVARLDRTRLPRPDRPLA